MEAIEPPAVLTDPVHVRWKLAEMARQVGALPDPNGRWVRSLTLIYQHLESLTLTLIYLGLPL